MEHNFASKSEKKDEWEKDTIFVGLFIFISVPRLYIILSDL